MNWLKNLFTAIENFFIDKKLESVTITPMEPPQTVQPQVQTTPVTPVVPTAENPDVMFAWDVSIGANKHNVRVLCDLSGLPYAAKNLITACIQVESNFQSYYLSDPNVGKPVSHENIVDGVVKSTDWGIVQINDLPTNKHICTTGCDFPSVEYVLTHTQECVQFMINAYKEGRISEWSSYGNLKAGIYPQVVQEYNLSFD